MGPLAIILFELTHTYTTCGRISHFLLNLRHSRAPLGSYSRHHFGLTHTYVYIARISLTSLIRPPQGVTPEARPLL